MNRKLIRTTLAEIKEKGREITIQKRAGLGHGPRHEHSGPRHERGSSSGGPPPDRERRPMTRPLPPPIVVEKPSKKKLPPPTDTSAEYYYYKKQIDAHVQMVIVLKDGEEIEGTIEWYDRNALKINRKGAPNLMLLKHNVKYMFKAEDREIGEEAE